MKRNIAIEVVMMMMMMMMMMIMMMMMMSKRRRRRRMMIITFLVMSSYLSNLARWEKCHVVPKVSSLQTLRKWRSRWRRRMEEEEEEGGVPDV